MKDLFKGYYRPDEAAFKEIWESGIFVFDTNIILRLSRWPTSVSSEFWKVIHKLSDRVWLPHQVALEFQRNRLSVIQEQQSKYSKVSDVFKKGFATISKEIADLNLAKSHSEIEPDAQLKAISDIIDAYTAELDEKRVTFADLYKNGKDSILSQIEHAFGKSVGQPLSQAQLESIYKAGPDAYNNKRPPGYRDKDKADSENYYFSGQKIIAKYGDVILWHQIIEKLKSLNQPTSIVFITDDAKEDWWWIAPGDKTIGPRPELVEDIQNSPNGKNFFMYNSDRFLKYAKQYLKLNLSDESIEQAKDIQELSKSKMSWNFSLSDRQLKEIEKHLLEGLYSLPSNSKWKGYHDSEINQLMPLDDLREINEIKTLIKDSVLARIKSSDPKNGLELNYIRERIKFDLINDFTDLINTYSFRNYSKAIDYILWDFINNKYGDDYSFAMSG